MIDKRSKLQNIRLLTRATPSFLPQSDEEDRKLHSGTAEPF
jgi:hypothetical protein